MKPSPNKPSAEVSGHLQESRPMPGRQQGADSSGQGRLRVWAADLRPTEAECSGALRFLGCVKLRGK